LEEIVVAFVLKAVSGTMGFGVYCYTGGGVIGPVKHIVSFRSGEVVEPIVLCIVRWCKS